MVKRQLCSKMLCYNLGKDKYNKILVFAVGFCLLFLEKLAIIRLYGLKKSDELCFTGTGNLDIMIIICSKTAISMQRGISLLSSRGTQ